MSEYITVWRGSMGSLRPVTDARLEDGPTDRIGRLVGPSNDALRKRRNLAEERTILEMSLGLGERALVSAEANPPPKRRPPSHRLRGYVAGSYIRRG